MNLVPAIHEIESEIQKLKCEYLKKMHDLQESLEALRNLNDTCEACDGKGKVYIKEDGSHMQCTKCHGSGVSGNYY